MKKAKPGPPSDRTSNSAPHNKPHTEKTRNHQEGAPHPSTPQRKTPAADKSSTPGGGSAKSQVINKNTFLSRSQDNLASQLRRKAVAAALSQKEAANNKENLTQKESKSSRNSTKTPKGSHSGSGQSGSSNNGTSATSGGSSSTVSASSGVAMPTVAKPVASSTSTPSLMTTTATSVTTTSPTTSHSSSCSTTAPPGGEQPIKRAQSAQNIDKTSTAQSSGQKTPGAPVKRASSTQNISGGKGGLKIRTSAPANIMAYNAELLASFEKEKKALERRISELIQIAEIRKTEIEKFKFEVKNLKENATLPSEEFEMLRHENRHLKDRLQELGVTVEQFTDTEKLLLQQAESLKGATGGDNVSSLRSVDSELGLSVGDLTCITPEHPSSLSLDNSNWDKQSNKSSDAMSEISVACLQDRILQMEETHYSTNEELQATLQELCDLQHSVQELTSENERLADERSVLLESLCAQTEKLENCRMQIEHLKVLLVSESEGAERSENERQLVALIKSAAEEREEFLLKQSQLSNTLAAYENENRELQDIIQALRDKVQILEMKNESLLGDKRALDTQVSEMKEAQAKDQIDLQRYKTLLDNEKSKVAELEQCHKATQKSDVEELLDNTRQEKDKVEKKLTNTQEELAVSQNMVTKLQEQLSSLEEEIKVAKNNAKTQLSDLEYRLGQVGGEKTDMQQEMESLRDHIDQLQLDCDRYLEEKKNHASIVADLQNEAKAAADKLLVLEDELRNTQHKFRDEQDEWQQFQQDLQTAVVIANDIKTETQEDAEQLREENAMLNKKNVLLIEELTKLGNEVEQLRQLKDRNEIRRGVINNVDRELTALRQGRKLSEPWGTASAQQSLSVKNLIASIEQQVKTNCTPPLSPSTSMTTSMTTATSASQESSRRNSVDSSYSVGSMKAESPIKSPGENRRASMPADTHFKSSLKKPTDLGKIGAVGESPSPRGCTALSSAAAHRSHALTDIIYEKAPPVAVGGVTDDAKVSPNGRGVDTPDGGKKPLTSILANKPALRKSCANDTDKSPIGGGMGLKSDPLAKLSKQMGGSKRNALLKWCQNKTQTYPNIDITNFSSSWNDGLAFCAILHSYLPDKIPYKELNTQDKRRNFTLAFKAAESVGIPATLNISDMVAIERPDWQAVMAYVTSIYKHFEVDAKLT